MRCAVRVVTATAQSNTSAPRKRDLAPRKACHPLRAGPGAQAERAWFSACLQAGPRGRDRRHAPCQGGSGTTARGVATQLQPPLPRQGLVGECFLPRHFWLPASTFSTSRAFPTESNALFLLLLPAAAALSSSLARAGTPWQKAGGGRELALGATSQHKRVQLPLPRGVTGWGDPGEMPSKLWPGEEEGTRTSASCC